MTHFRGGEPFTAEDAEVAEGHGRMGARERGGMGA